MPGIVVKQTTEGRSFAIIEEDNKDEPFHLFINEEHFECKYYGQQFLAYLTREMLKRALPEIKEFLRQRLQKDPEIANYLEEKNSASKESQPYFIGKRISAESKNFVHRVKIDEDHVNYQYGADPATNYQIITNENNFRIECTSTLEHVEDVLKEVFFAVCEAYEAKIICEFTSQTK